MTNEVQSQDQIDKENSLKKGSVFSTFGGDTSDKIEPEVIEAGEVEQDSSMWDEFVSRWEDMRELSDHLTFIADNLRAVERVDGSQLLDDAVKYVSMAKKKLYAAFDHERTTISANTDVPCPITFP